MACFCTANTCSTGSPVARAPGIAAADVCREWSARPAAAVDMADESVPLQERLILLRAIGGVGPDAAARVRGVEQALAQPMPVVPAGVGDVPAADQSIPSVDARVRLGAEARDRNLRHRAILIASGLAGLDGPTSVNVFLARLRRLVRPDFMGAPACLHGLLLVPGFPLLGRRHQSAVDELARHGNVSGRTDGRVELSEQPRRSRPPGSAARGTSRSSWRPAPGRSARGRGSA